MLKRFAQILTSRPETEEEPQPERLALATCVVLIEAASADEDFTDDERGHILAVMGKRFSLSDEEARDLLADAMEAHDESKDLWHFTHEINKAFSREEKIQIIEEIWRIFYSDGTLSGHEDHLAHKLLTLLNLNHRQLIDAKMKVRKEFDL
jgi:uncharacterized tellurite resistance protein B-like protein